ncbi:hypothetical protein PARMER_00009 [Parabacteroides merdae ATCC 43184]|nr:hypothetical protein PARMER_00009 [Parabacteroides merdae ATCC 43184]
MAIEIERIRKKVYICHRIGSVFPVREYGLKGNRV